LDAGEANQLRDLHLAYYVDWAEKQEARMKTSEQGEAIAQADAEIHNIRSALSWALDESPNPQPLAGLRLANAITPYFDLRGFRIQDWLDKGLKLFQGEDPEYLNIRAKACLNISKSSIFQEYYYESAQLEIRRMMMESVRLYRLSGDRLGLGLALVVYGEDLGQFNPLFPMQQDLDQARQVLDESEAIFRELGDAWGLGVALLGKSRIAASDQSDLFTGLRYAHQALQIFRNIGDRIKIAEACLDVTSFLVFQGEYAPARIFLDETIALGREFNSKIILFSTLWGSIVILFFQSDYRQMEKCALELYEFGRETRHMIYTICGLRYTGIAVLFQGQAQRARQLLLESLSLSQEIDDMGGIIMFPILMAGVADTEGHPQAAARLVGAFEVLNERNFKPLDYFDQGQYQRILEAARSHLDEATFESERAEGRAMTLEQAIAYAKEV
jgi:hypothetical protein